jgi:hypothetical protein
MIFYYRKCMLADLDVSLTILLPPYLMHIYLVFLHFLKKNSSNSITSKECTLIHLLTICILFNDLIYNSHYRHIESNSWTKLDKKWTGNYVEGSGRDLVSRYRPNTSYSDWRKPRETSVKRTGIPAEIRTKRIPNTQSEAPPLRAAFSVCLH